MPRSALGGANAPRGAGVLCEPGPVGGGRHELAEAPTAGGAAEPGAEPPAGAAVLVHTPLVRRVLVGLVLALASLSVGGVLALWPSGELAGAPDSVERGVDVHRASVLSVTQASCPGTSEDRLPDGTVPLDTSCPTALLQLEEGPDAGGTTEVPVPAQVVRGGLAVGTDVEVALYPEDVSAGVGATYVWVDFSRTLPLAVVVGAFVLVVLAVGRWKGLAALGGLVVAYLMIVGFIIPALLEGSSPVLVTLSAATAIMSVVLYLAHGFSMKTTAALLGTVLGLVLTALMARVAVGAVNLRGLGNEDAYYLTTMTGEADLSGLVLAGMIVAGLGVLNDVTITQASAVWEFREHSPAASFRQLFGSGMRVGRDHLASTIYTVAFAYAGAALPTLVIIHLYQQPFGQVITSSGIAEEIVRTAIGAVGLVVAIPFTTAVAAAAVVSAAVVLDPTAPARAPGHHH